MPSDPCDLLQARREALTAWERGFRPKTERHWVLWLGLALLLVFGAWRCAEWLLLQQHAPRPASAPLAARLSVAPVPAVGDSAPASLTRPTPHLGYGVTKCTSAAGKAEYSDRPCPTGSHTATVWVQPDVNLADDLSTAEREASMQNNSEVAAQVQQQDRRVAQNAGGHSASARA